MKAEEVKPYDVERPKGKQVEEMFDSIAPAYDFMNNAMSFGLHRKWLRKALAALKAVAPSAPAGIVDLATGTGEVAFALERLYPGTPVTGVDLSEGMLAIARGKAADSRVRFIQGDCLNLDFPDNSVDILTIAYGVRNFEDLAKGFSEFHRVLKPGGTCLILELSRPSGLPARLGYDVYSRGIIPLVGRLVSKDTRAYSYLPKSIAAMPPKKKIAEMLLEEGFGKVEAKSLTLGVVTYFLAVK